MNLNAQDKVNKLSQDTKSATKDLMQAHIKKKRHLQL